MTPLALSLAVWTLAHTPGADEPPAPRWAVRSAETASRLRGLCVADDRVVWASGTDGTFTRTTDGGATWGAGRVPGAETLDFRDVQAWDASNACLLASGPGNASRVYRTADGGKTWALVFTNPDPDGFLDAFAFRDRRHGLILGDPVAGRFRVFRTDDGGLTWRRPDPETMPEARRGEGAFAASGTCLAVVPPPATGPAWFVSGGTAGSRVFRTGDGGRSWSAHDVPRPAGPASSGLSSVAFLDGREGLAVGGDYQSPDRPGPAVFRTGDGGATWDAVAGGPQGYRSGVAVAAGPVAVAVAVGPTGSDLSTDGGRTWVPLGPEGFHAVALTPSGSTAWAVGDRGKVARLDLAPRRRY